MKYLFTILIMLILVSCEDFFETTLELEEPDFESQLVLSAIFENIEYDRRVLLTETVGLNDNSREAVVTEADIVLSLPSGNTETFVLMENVPNDGYSHMKDTDQFLEKGTYSIMASTPDGRSVSAMAELPDAVEIVSGLYIEDGGKDEFGDETDALDITIADDPDQENYYKVRISTIDGFGENQIYLDSNDPSISESSIYNSLIISDSQFNGEEYRLRFLIEDYNEGTTAYKVSFSSINEDQYRFDKVLQSYQENKDNPFSTPVQIHTNMEGGLGIFAIENVVEYLVEK